MADASGQARFLNPWVLHLQKMCLELTCPLCLTLFNRPMLLPCNHIVCNSCVPKSGQFGSECHVCNQSYADRDLRPAPYVDNIVTIYKSLDATLSAGLIQPRTPAALHAGREPHQSTVSLETNGGNEQKESVETPQEGNYSSNGQGAFSLSANKRVWASLKLSAEEGNKFSGTFDKSSPPITTTMGGFMMSDEDGMVFQGGSKLIPSQYSDWSSKAKFQEVGVDEIDVNQVLQSSQLSPYSFDPKGMNDDSSDPASSNDIIPGAGEVPAREVKRQKKLNDGCTQSAVFPSDSLATSSLESKSRDLSGAKSPKISDSCNTNVSICAFCQTSDLTDRTGPMLHYLSGKEVMGDAATCSNVIHVHKLCIEWTPQVYFVGDTVKNLKAEVARAAKLKCSCCNLRGAALGCFMKSCRKSYHVPCAAEKDDCRWDFEDFLLLCPKHSSVSFPREKSKSGKHAREKQQFVPTTLNSEQSNFWGASSKQWVFCGSALSAEEKYLLVKFASICGATVSKFWRPSVTHIISATDAKGACTRTLKVLKAILNGRWIVKTDWIQACIEATHPVDEEPYEVSLDNHGCCDGPKVGRLNALNNVPKLFGSLNFYFSGDFIPAYKEDLLDLVVTAGGAIIESKEELVAQGHVAQTNSSAMMIVYNQDPSQACKSEEGGSVVLRRREVAEDLADEIESQVANEIEFQVIPHTWLLESIAACKLQPTGF